ncbi:MAG: MFS transporter [Methylococcales bacterium]|nr:MFS transporter [Methylococcales bacterium]
MSTVQDITSPMSASEKKATWSLASVYALRMLGLFMILPVLPLFAEQLEGSTPALIGLAMGIYGLPQVLLQIPFGLLSDKFGRKKIILIGLSLFFIGSVIAALSSTIYGVLIGRAFQGAGAVSAVVMALVADLTQEVHRTKAMAMIGASIGASFGIGMVAGPIISGFGGVQMVFAATAVLTLLAMLSVLYVVPNPQKSKLHRDAEFVPEQAMSALKNPDLLRLDYGIFVQHLLLMAIFVVVPSLMRQAGLQAGQEWQVYLPVFATSMAVMIPFIILAEKKRKMKAVFLGAVAVLALSTLGLSFLHDELISIIGFLWVFFCGFNLLEATLPSLISKTAPADLKGTAMGAYSSSQFMGLFLGGALGGWFNGRYGVTAVFLFCAVMAFSWFLVSLTMKQPRYLSNMLISLENVNEQTSTGFVSQLLAIAGVVEVTVHHEEAVAYLKVDSHLLNKDQLQNLIAQYTSV